MIYRVLLYGLLAFAGLVHAAESSDDALQFTVDVAGIYRDSNVAAQLLVTSPSSDSLVQRFIAAFPDGNSGAMFYLVNANDSEATFQNMSTQTSSRLRMTLLNDTIEPVTMENNVKGVTGDLGVSGSCSLGVAILGGVRTIRDYTEGGGLMHGLFNYTLGDYSDSSITLHHKWVNGSNFMNLTLSSSDTSKVRLQVTPSTNETQPPACNFIVQGNASDARITYRVVFNETSIGEGYPKPELFLSSSNSTCPSALDQAIENLYGESSDPASHVSFLTYRSKFLAGGWRFLTYFGRDDLLSLRLYMSLLQSEPIEAAIAGVLERLYVNGTNTSPVDPVTQGEVCHEETLGDYATFINLGNNRSDLGNDPYYAYPMVDTGFLLLPTVGHYFLDLSQGKGRSEQFLAMTSGGAFTGNMTYAELLDMNVQFVMSASKPFAENPSVENLIHLKYTEPVGNWRDSNTGLGYGTIPFDVNVAFVPGCLRAIERLADAGIIDSGYKSDAQTYAAVWEEHASEYFEVSGPVETMFGRVANYTAWAQLPESYNYAEGPFNDTAFKIAGAEAATENHGWLNVNNGTLTFYALSLFNDSTPVAVQNSDIGIPLLYANNVSETFLKAVSDALLPFPKGLVSPVSLMVANPAMDTNFTNFDTFNRSMYHGTVVWGWQIAMMASGLIRQLSFCDNSTLPLVDQYDSPGSMPEWCNNQQLVGSLKAGLDRLWQSIEGVGENIWTEVWSYSYSNDEFSVLDLGAISTTESNAVQLWSYGRLGLLDPRTYTSSNCPGSNASTTTGTPSGTGVDTTNETLRLVTEPTYVLAALLTVCFMFL